MSKPYPQDLHDRAVRLVLEMKDQYPSENQAIVSIAAKLGIATAQTLRNWVRQAEVDTGARPGGRSRSCAAPTTFSRLRPVSSRPSSTGHSHARELYR